MILATIPYLQWLVSWIEDLCWIGAGIWVIMALPKKAEQNAKDGFLTPDAASKKKKGYRLFGCALICAFLIQFFIHIFSEHT